MDRGAWWATAHWVLKVSQKNLSNYITITTAATFYSWSSGQIVLHLKLETGLQGGPFFDWLVLFSSCSQKGLAKIPVSSYHSPLNNLDQSLSKL